MAVTMMNGNQPKKVRWGELEDDDEAEDLSYLLPPKQVIGPDANGLKKIIEYKFNKDGHKVKVTTTVRVRKVVTQQHKRAIERRSWAKFGDAEDEDVSSGLTTISHEVITIERPKPPGAKEEDTVKKPIGPNDGTLKLCRFCGKKGDHWSAQCPFKHLAETSDVSADQPSTPTTRPPSSDGKPRKYVPPNRLKQGADRPDMRRRNEDNALRVTNLSEDTREDDLRELFGVFGHVTRVYIGVDRSTGLSRGFGFVSFANREDAERALAKLNGYGYDNLILHVEWSIPRS